VCRKYYIHPALLSAYLEGSVLPPLPERTKWSNRKHSGPVLRQHEMDVLAFIKSRLKHDHNKPALSATSQPRSTSQPQANKPAA
jgi:DNA topoisomerase IB